MPRYDDDDDFADIRRKRLEETRPRSHSALGIISLFLGAGAGATAFLMIVVAVIVSAGRNGQVNDKDPAMIVVGLGIIASAAAALAGFVIGAAGCFQSDRNILCAVLGSILNAVLILGVMFLLCLGLIAGR